jgi:hypothetical protein
MVFAGDFTHLISVFYQDLRISFGLMVTQSFPSCFLKLAFKRPPRSVPRCASNCIQLVDSRNEAKKTLTVAIRARVTERSYLELAKPLDRSLLIVMIVT